jgi:hypothetical protein
MTEHQTSRTLLKSPPELWAECSDVASLARHLGRFGEIRITRLEPETAVAWEGERASGTVRLEPSGWGTRVILTARAEADASNGVPGAEGNAVTPAGHTGVEGHTVALAEDAGEKDAEPEPSGTPIITPHPVATDPDPEPTRLEVAAPEPAPLGRHGLMARLLSMFGARRAVAPESTAPQPVVPPEPEPVVPPEPEPVPPEPEPVSPEPEPVTAASPIPVGLPAAPVAMPVEPGPPERVDPEPPEPFVSGRPDAPESVASDRPDPPEPVASDRPDPLDPEAALAAALDSLGQAHHRPFSRA